MLYSSVYPQRLARNLLHIKNSINGYWAKLGLLIFFWKHWKKMTLFQGQLSSVLLTNGHPLNLYLDSPCSGTLNFLSEKGHLVDQPIYCNASSSGNQQFCTPKTNHRFWSPKGA